jgi:tetratricopeptide (TPR) repeat protein
MSTLDCSIFIESLPDIEQPGCPLELKKYSLGRNVDSNIYTKFVIINNSNTFVHAFKIKIECYNSLSDQIDYNLEPFIATYQDLNYPGRSEFISSEWICLVNRPETRRIRAIFEKVLFQNGSMWIEKSSRINEIPSTNILDPKSLNDLRLITGKNALVYACEEHEYWICVCGKTNNDNLEICKRCGREKRMVLALLTYDKVLDQILMRKNEIERAVKRRSEAEMAIKNEKLRQENLRREIEERQEKVLNEEHRRKRKKIIFTSISSFIIVGLLSGIVYFIGVPFGNYLYANLLRNRARYLDALEIYETLPNYYGNGLYIETYMQYANHEFERGDYIKAQSLYNAEESNPLFSDYYDEMLYMQGCCAEERESFVEALDFFERSSTYVSGEKVSSKKIEYIIDILAQEYENQGNLKAAYHLYIRILETNSEAEKKITELQIRMVNDSTTLKNNIKSAVLAKDYERAYELYSQLLEFESEYTQIFESSITTQGDMQNLENEIFRANSLSQISILKDEFNRNMGIREYTKAVNCLNNINDINIVFRNKIGLSAISDYEIKEYFTLVADKILAMNTFDTLENKYIGQAYLKTGIDPDPPKGTKMNEFTKGEAFGLFIDQLSFDGHIIVKWYQRKVKYLSTEILNQYITEHEPVEENNIGWYFYFNKFDNERGFYYVEIIHKFASTQGSEKPVGRFYFRII